MPRPPPRSQGHKRRGHHQASQNRRDESVANITGDRRAKTITKVTNAQGITKLFSDGKAESVANSTGDRRAKTVTKVATVTSVQDITKLLRERNAENVAKVRRVFSTE